MINKQLLLENMKEKLGQKTKEPAEKNPYDQKDLESYIRNKDYNVEENPRLSEIAASLQSPKTETAEPKKTLQIKQEDSEMLQKFIDKYKGKK